MGNILLSPDKYYHIYKHANSNENLFRCDDNYTYFLKKYAEYINPIASTFSYCLMPNHFHFLIQINNENELIESFKLKYGDKITFRNQDLQGFKNLEGLISQQFSNFFNAYTKAYNKRYLRKGNLFLVNFRRKEINNTLYLQRIIHYIHYNPVHHNFASDLRDWKYSSFESFFSNKTTNLKKEQVIDWFQNINNFINYHKNDNTGFEPEFD